ncbi:MAG: hypothetical protein M9915_17690 [Rhizobacter sp.]|nr:hypothetical protein [Rhizobacter sp.]
MTTRRGLMATAAFAGAALSIKPALAQAKQADFLFVQNAASMSYANGKLTMKDVSPVTIFFSDRPERIAGNMPTQAWVPFWSDGKDSFAKDNPNANLSVLEKDKALEDIVVTLSNPVLNGRDLSYDVKLVQGTMPASGGPASLFIDIIGMPLTPMSYAGVARRTAYRRAVIYR